MASLNGWVIIFNFPIVKETIVLNAWEMVTRFHSLKKLNFFPSFFGMSWLLIVLTYQVVFVGIYLFNKQDEALSMLYDLFSETYFWEGVLVVACIFLAYILFTPIARGGLIHMMSTYREGNGKDYHRTSQGIFDGFSHFLPIFEIQNVTAIFSPLTIITTYIFALRLFGMEFFLLISGIMGAYLMFAFIVNMCFAYAPFFVIFEGKRGLESLSASTGLTVRNINITARLYFTNILLYLRTLFVGGIFLLMPFLITGALAYFTIASVKFAFMIIFLVIAIVLFIIIAHLNSTLEIFILALWYEAYLACKQEEARLASQTETP